MMIHWSSPLNVPSRVYDIRIFVNMVVEYMHAFRLIKQLRGGSHSISRLGVAQANFSNLNSYSPMPVPKRLV